MADTLPTLFVDHAFPDLYLDLIDERACLVDDLSRADGVIAGAVLPWNAEALQGAPEVKVVSRVGVGYDNVDVDSLATIGVAACNAPFAPLVSTAEQTIALMLAITKHLPERIAQAQRGEKGGGVGYGMELDGRYLGLVGFGRIAGRVAAAAIGLGMEVLACDPYLDQLRIPGVALVDFDEVLARSDVVSLHAPATSETIGLMGTSAFAAMKPGAFLVNCARGTLVDTGALVEAIDSGHLAGAGLDVTDPEPLPVDHPLLDRDNVVVTPHIASNTVAGRRRLYAHAINHALDYLAGQPRHVIPPSNDGPAKNGVDNQ